MSNTNTGLANIHDRKLYEITIVSYNNIPYNIADLYLKFSFCEGITVPFLFGDITLFDAIDLPTLLPIIGEERIKAKFTKTNVTDPELKSDYKPISFDMQVYKMDGKTQIGGARKKQIYKLHYSSKISFTNQKKVIYATYKGMLYSDMVKKIYEDYIKEDGDHYKPLVVEPTKYTADFYIQGLKPIEAINEICKRAFSAKDNGSMYVFYEDRDAYRFVTINGLMQQPSKMTLNCELKNITTDSSNKDIDLSRQAFNVDSYHRATSFDIFDSIISGEGCSSLLSIDPTLRRFYYSEFDLRKQDETGKDNWGKYPKLSSKKPWTEKNEMFASPRGKLTVAITDHEWATDDIIAKKSSETGVYSRQDFMLEKMSMINQLKKITINIKVAGNPELKAGDVVTFDVPELSGASLSGKKDEESDKWIKGKYLVFAIAHVVENNDYYMGLQLVKDGFETDIFHRDPTEYGEGE